MHYSTNTTYYHLYNTFGQLLLHSQLLPGGGSPAFCRMKIWNMYRAHGNRGKSKCIILVQFSRSEFMVHARDL